jgi:hypothetical protein
MDTSWDNLVRVCTDPITRAGEVSIGTSASVKRFGRLQDHPNHTRRQKAYETRQWHNMPIRCAAAITSGYRITFAVPVRRLAGERLTQKRSLSP